MPFIADKTRLILYDLAGRLPCGAYFGFYSVVNFRATVRRFGLDDGWRHIVALPPVELANAIAGCGAALFMLLVAVWTLVRLKSVNSNVPFASRAIAIAGTFAIMPIGALPVIFLPEWAALGTLAVMLTGYLFGIVSLCFLGRSFSIVPEARRIVANGPYKCIRHPLYLAEMMLVSCVCLQHASFIAAQLWLVHVLLQFRRMRLEEDMLTSTFPAYEDYRARTWKVLPGLH